MVFLHGVLVLNFIADLSPFLASDASLYADFLGWVAYVCVHFGNVLLRTYAVL